MHYFGLISGLPVLKPLQSPPLSFVEAKELIFQYLTDNDKEVIHHFFYQIDLINFNSLAQDKPLWIEGGNLDKEGLEAWFKTGKIEDTLFGTEKQNVELTETPPIDRLQVYWELFYKTLFSITGSSFSELIIFEISLKNFFKGHLERIIKSEPGIHFIEGGSFDRFAYNKLQIGDIQAEHPFLASVLGAFDMKDPFDRELKILEQKWKFYDHNTFFEPFSLNALFCWLLKLLDLHKWQLNNAEKGAMLINEIESELLQKTQSKFI